MGQKIAFGLGMFANQMFPAILGIFMVVLVQDLGFSGLMWGMIYFFPRVFDSITDPIMGFISDNTRSKWGSLVFLSWIHSVLSGAYHLQCSLRSDGLRDERRLPRAHQHHGYGAVDRPVGLGNSSLVLDNYV